MRPGCSFEGCESAAVKRGLCERHYLHERRAGRLGLHKPMPRGKIRRTWELAAESAGGICRAVECEKPAVAQGLCHDCYVGLRRKGVIVTDQLTRQKAENASGVCSVGGCSNKPRHRGLCTKHYHRWHKHGDPAHETEWEKNRGKPKLTEKGYAFVYAPDNPMAWKNGCVFVHRLVMAEIIGRPLEKNETPHHVNGVRSDNRPKNLELWVTSQPSGQRVQDLVAWAKEILATYPDELVARIEQSRGVG